MIVHNGDNKRIAPIILDIHMSIVSEQWINYSCPMFIYFQTSCMSLCSELSISRLFIHALPLEIQLLKRRGLGAPLVCLIPPHVLSCPKPESGFLTSSFVGFLLCPVTMIGDCFALFYFGWFKDHYCFSKTLENIEGAIKNGQSRETSSVGYTSRINTKQKHNTICVGHHYNK